MMVPDDLQDRPQFLVGRAHLITQSWMPPDRRALRLRQRVRLLQDLQVDTDLPDIVQNGPGPQRHPVERKRKRAHPF